MLFADRLEVWNPGTLLPSLTLQQLREPHGSVPANPLPAEPLYLAKYIERMGAGTRDKGRVWLAARDKEGTPIEFITKNTEFQFGAVGLGPLGSQTVGRIGGCECGGRHEHLPCGTQSERDMRIPVKVSSAPLMLSSNR